LVQVADEPIGWHPNLVEQHPVLTASGDVVERPQLEARSVNRGHEVADPSMTLGIVGIGPSGDDYPVAMMSGGAVRLFPSDDPFVSVLFGCGT
jgi:hypothetical protein